MNETIPNTDRKSFLATLQALSLQQQITAAIAMVAVIVGCFVLINMAGRESKALLYAGLDAAAAGQIATELDGMGVPYTVEGSAIMVPVSQRDRLRIEMARQGLPAATYAGYELLDDLNGFSTTSDMFDAAYWRAKEGEIARTVAAMPAVRSARVHLGITKGSAFRRSADSKSASVTIDAPYALVREQATSIQFLTALAVPELSPENVAVIDSQRGVIAGPGGPDESMGPTDQADREQALANRLTRLLEAHVGLDNAQVSVAMQIDTQSVAQTERVIDPDSRQIARRSIQEERDMETDGEGVVTVASNLPDGELSANDPDAPVMRATRDEDVTYTGTEIERVTEQRAGGVARLSVAVLLNERFRINEAGEREMDPRSPQELAAIESLVASAAGIDADRGDQLTVQILPFEPLAEVDIPAPGFVDQFIMPRAVETAQMVFLGLIIIVVGLFILKPALTPKPLPEGVGGPAALNSRPLDAATLLTMLTEENPDEAVAILDEWFEDERETA